MTISSSKSERKLPSVTADEQRLLQISVDLAREQLASTQRQSEIQKFLFDQFPEIFDFAGQPALDPNAFAEDLDALRGDVNQSRVDIERAAENALRLGESDIARFQQQGLEGIRDVLAPSRGLRPGDSPILAAGGNIVEEALRQQGQLVRSVRGQEAAALSSLPFERGAATLDFQQALAQQAFQNRLALTGEVGRLGVGLDPGQNVAGALAVAQQPRLGAGTTRTRGLEIDAGSAIGSLVGGFCWVAGEIYGYGSHEWISARRWILDGLTGRCGAWFRQFYGNWGRPWAACVRRSRVARMASWVIFEWARRRGEVMDAE